MDYAKTTQNFRQLSANKKFADQEDWWRGAVIYQIYPRSYQDTTGDGIGDLAGITSRLDYVASLGVDAIWLSPFFTSPMDDFGYDVADHCQVDPMFGDLASIDTLLEKAHGLGIRVMIDLVLSHTSDIHAWFKQSRSNNTNSKNDWYVWANAKTDGTPPNNWLSIFGGSAWEWDTNRRQYYLHNFLASQPDLNFHNIDVQDAALDIARFWLDRGVDGFRLDTVNMYFHDAQLRNNPSVDADGPVNGIPDNNPYSFQIPQYNINRPENLTFIGRLRELMDQYPGTATVGELGAVSNMYTMTAAYTLKDQRLSMAYSFDLLSSRFSAKHIRDVVSRMEENIGDGWASYAFSNHDVQRVITRWQLEHRSDIAPCLIALLTCLRGTPCIYQGDELALPDVAIAREDLRDPYGIRFWPELPSRDGCRTPMPWADDPTVGFGNVKPWLPTSKAHQELSVERQETDRQSVLHRTRTFLNWRKLQQVLKTGSIRFVDIEEPVIAFWRESSEDAVFCAFNLGESVQTLVLDDYVTGQSASGFCDEIHTIKIILEPGSAFFARKTDKPKQETPWQA